MGNHIRDFFVRVAIYPINMMLIFDEIHQIQEQYELENYRVE